MVIPVGQTVTRQGTLVHYLPGILETSLAAQQLPFPCVFYRAGPIDQTITSNFPALTGDNDAPRLSNMQINELAHQITDVKLDQLCKTREQLDLQMAGDPTVPTPPITFEQLLDFHLPTMASKQAFLKSHEATKVSNMSAASFYGGKVKTCGVHFSKLSRRSL